MLSPSRSSAAATFQDFVEQVQIEILVSTEELNLKKNAVIVRFLRLRLINGVLAYGRFPRNDLADVMQLDRRHLLISVLPLLLQLRFRLNATCSDLIYAFPSAKPCGEDVLTTPRRTFLLVPAPAIVFPMAWL